MEIVDAQIHQPTAARPLDGYPEDVNDLVSVELAREAMDCVGVDAALVNAAPRFCEAALTRYPDRFAACVSWDVGIADPEAWLGAYRKRLGMLAIRVRTVSWSLDRPTPDFESGRLEPLFSAAEKLGVPLFFSTHGHAELLTPVARAHPGLAVIVDHLGLSEPPVTRRRPDPWDRLPAVLEFAKCPNAAMKFSGAPALSVEPYPHRDIWPYLHKIIEAYRPDRLMWGSDFTRLRMREGSTERGPRESWAGLYSDSVNYLRDTSEISAADKAEIFAGTIRRLLGWPKPSGDIG